LPAFSCCYACCFGLGDDRPPLSRRRGPSRTPTPASSSATATGRRSPTSISRRSRDGGRRPGRHVLANLAGGRFNASSTIPVHGADPWVIVETPTRHHPRRRGRPIPRRLLLVWSERVRISSTVAGAHLRWLGSHARGDPQKQRRQHARTRRGFFGTRVFFVRLRLFRRRSRGGVRRHTSSPATRRGASPPTSPSCRSCCALDRTLPPCTTAEEAARAAGSAMSKWSAADVFARDAAHDFVPRVTDIPA
jgi:hypothetical protein